MTGAKSLGTDALSMVNPDVAAIDIGSTMHMAAISPQTDDNPVRAFGKFTGELREMARWFKASGVTSVAMDVHDPQAIRLAEHVRLRDLAVAQVVQLGNQFESIADTAMRGLIVSQVARVKALALRIKKAIAAVIAASPDLAAR